MSDRTHLRPLSPAKRIAQLEEQLERALRELEETRAVLSDYLQEKPTDWDARIHANERPTAAELRAMPTISSGHTDNLKIETRNFQVWLSRMTVADGADYDDQVTLELRDHGQWVIVEEYRG